MVNRSPADDMMICFFILLFVLSGCSSMMPSMDAVKNFGQGVGQGIGKDIGMGVKEGLQEKMQARQKMDNLILDDLDDMLPYSSQPAVRDQIKRMQKELRDVRQKLDLVVHDGLDEEDLAKVQQLKKKGSSIHHEGHKNIFLYVLKANHLEEARKKRIQNLIRLHQKALQQLKESDYEPSYIP